MMAHPRFRILLFILLNVVSIFVAQAQSYVFKNYSTIDDLPHSKVNCVFQASDGYLWFGTEGGLSRFDGMQFHNYSVLDSLSESNATAITQDKNGNLWIGHLTGGLSRYNGKNFEKITLPDSIKPTRIFSIFSDKESTLWISTEGAGVIKIECSEIDKQKPQAKAYKKDQGLWNIVTNVFQERSGKLWFITDAGMRWYDTATKKFQPFVHDEMTNYGVTSMTEDKEGDIYFGTFQGGIAHWKRKSDKFELLNLASGLPSLDIFSLICDNKGRIVIGTWGGGLVIYNGKTFEQITTREGLAGNKIRCLFQDREMNIWAGTNEDGISCYKGKRFMSYAKSEGLKSTIVNSVLQDKNGTYWIGTANGITVFSLDRNGKIQNQKSVSLLESNGNNEIRSLALTGNGNILAGTNGGGAAIINSNDLKIVKVFSLLAPNVNQVYSDHTGGLWFSMVAGLTRYRENSTPAYENFGKYNGLSGNDIACVFEDSKHNIWIGTHNGWLTKMESGKSKFTVYDAASGLTHSSPVCISEDARGRLWIGTEGGGIFCMDGQKFTHLGVKDGLPSDYITLVKCSGEYIWIGSNKGITKFYPDKKFWRTYNTQDGLPGNEVRLNSGCINANGEFMFGTTSGLAHYYPGFDKINPTEAKTWITKFRIFLNEANMSTDTVLSYKEHDVSFDFIGLSYAGPENVKYTYKLDGHDENWHPATHVSTANYTSLSPGNYTFLVKATNNEGIWNSTPATFAFEILPPWYLTKFAFAVYLILLIGGPIVFVRWRTRKLRLDKEFLELQVKERTLEIAQQNTKLELANVEIMRNRDEIAEKNKDITDSIEYAKRIQTSILPLDTEIKKILPESFVLFKPRDIVSGDFYWFTETEKDGTRYGIIAQGDCTGHGVPGAFLTMIGNNFLDQIVIENRIISPEEILFNLNNYIKHALKQADEEGGSRDGMDISICTLNLSTFELEFASANRPVYFFFNGELEVIPPDKTAIGGFTPDNHVFKKHKVKAQKQSVFYMFSDGYADQFGGPDGKKFMTRKLKDILVEIHHKPMEEQFRILETTIDEWKKDHEQIDDITAVGVKLI